MIMKKIIKILIVNLLAVVIFFIAAEFFCIYLLYKGSNEEEYGLKTHINQIIKSYMSNSYFGEGTFRGVSKGNTNKKSLAVIGCSYAYGSYLQDDETLSFLLRKETDRTTYNLGVVGGSPREMLYILRDTELREELTNSDKDIEFFIYPFISHHLIRLYTDIRMYASTPYFKQTKSGLIYYKKNKFLVNSYLYKKILEIIYSKRDDIQAFNLFSIYMKEINKEIKKHFNNAKFVILVYEDYHNYDWSGFEKEGIIVLKVSDIAKIDVTSPEYTYSQTDAHPNAKAWAVIVPQLAKKLNLI